MKQTRFFSLNLRTDDNKKFCLEGVAASYNVLSGDLGGFREQIAPGAFSRSLKDNDDVVALLNHDHNHVLGRVKSGTLNIFDLAKGLGFRCQLDPDNANHRDVYAMVKRGDIDQCSFAFTVPDGGDAWDEDVDDRGERFIRRTLRDLNLHDVSVVTRPAYDADGATSVDARSVHRGMQILSSQATRKPASRSPLANMPIGVDAYHRLRCKQIGQEIEEDFQRRIEAANRAVAADREKGDI